jgi:DNA processing protein
MGSQTPPTKKEQKTVGVGLDELVALLSLDQVRGFGPGAFRATHEEGIRFEALLEDPSLLPIEGKRGESLRRKIASLGRDEHTLARERAIRQLERAAELGVTILTYRSPDYPPNLLISNGAVPLLYASGDVGVLKRGNVVACVGSRKIRPRYVEQLRSFSGLAAEAGWLVASGFANGADTIAHRAAVDAGGMTVLVMPSGLDIPFPPENRQLWKEWQERPGVAMISEFPLGTKASALTLRKRNKTTVGVSAAVLIAQTSLKGGTMNAYRFALEQHKPILTFPPDDHADTSGNRLIREDENKQEDLLEEGSFPLPELEHWLARSSSI